jgi:hypothetical protein
MYRARHYLGSLFLIAALSAPAITAGCAARAGYGVRVYDRDHHDYHNWDNREDQAYRRYLGERHEDYRDFSKLNRNEQNDYWNWRHSHPDSDNR